jgi:uncharacterized protein YciI
MHHQNRERSMPHRLAILALAACCGATCRAQAPAAPAPPFDAELARSVGADENGMRRYVLVMLKTGPKPHPAGPERDEIFKGHFANMTRLANEGKLIVAGPLGGVEGVRGMFVFAVSDVEQARQLTATDPVIASGEMVAEYHRYYGSAALMLVNENHKKVARKSF